MTRPRPVPSVRPRSLAPAICLLLALTVSACTPGFLENDPPESDTTRPSEEFPDITLPESMVDTVAGETELPELPPQDESLLQKILRTHPRLTELEDLYVEGGNQYFEGDLDLAEEYFYLLQDRVEGAREDQPDSLALLYLGSLDRKLTNFIEILSEERFFSESYAPLSQSLTDAYDSLRVHYGLPDFLLPEMPEPSSFQRELLAIDNEKVQSWVEYFTGRGRKTFQRWLDRKAEVGWIIEAVLEEEELPRELIYMSMIESGLHPTARSRAAAVGYWQFVRSTARNRGLVVNEWLDERHDIEKATRAACRHIQLLYGMFQNWPLALAGYNAGEYRIQRAIGLQGDPDYWELRLPRETRNYVPKFIAAVRVGENAEEYGFRVAPGDTLRFDAIEVDDTFGLDQIAEAGDFSVRELERLNPQLVAGCTPPNTDRYRLRVPLGRGDATEVAVREIPEDQRISWRKHRMRSGETLGQLARRYRTTVQSIMDLNGIRNPRRVRAGTELTIPYPRGVQVASSTNVAASRPQTGPGDGEKTIRYRIKSGDTLSNIATRHHTTVSRIQRTNGLRGHRIRAGSDLFVHVDESHPATAVSQEVLAQARPSGSYVVRRGDTLIAIARRAGVPLSDLLAWNGLSRNSTIRPGDRLRLGPPSSG